ncbi:MAG: ribosome biogenesis GTPase YlqF [Clostridia bacterium]|nr:ribosome biogenesis GTPase YlqF [Clostridia bacterium]
MNLQWFPGHMAKTRRMMQDSLKLCDIAAELLDARIPMASRNPEIDRILGKKPRVVILNKSDMADPETNKAWIEYFAKKGIAAIEVSCATGKGINKLSAYAEKVLKEKIERDKQRGITRSIKIMLCGIPNVGKSSFINRVAGKAVTKTGDRPGVTRGKQWLRLDNGVELLDMPGILWPKFESDDVALKLAFTGAIRDEIMDVEELACLLIKFLRERYESNLIGRYKLENITDLTDYEVLIQIAEKRGFLLKKGEFDTLRAANILLDEFRDCRLGNITMETPDEF